MTLKEDLLPALAGNHLFSIFSQGEVERVLKHAAIEIFSDGERIFVQGEDPDKFYLILSGGVTITQSIPRKTECALANLGEGETLGEMSFLDRFPRSATAVANGATCLLAFEFASFDRLIAWDNELAVKWFWLFGRALAQRLREANERIKELIEGRPGDTGIPSA